MNIYFDEGYQAYKDGKQLDDNPYIDCGCFYKQNEWIDGWNIARIEFTS